MSQAIVQIQGHQYLVTAKDEILIDRLDKKEKDKVDFSNVLLLIDGEKVEVGKPVVAGATVKATVLEHSQGPKIRVATYKAKSRTRRVKGHRSAQTKIRIDQITTK